MAIPNPLPTLPNKFSLGTLQFLNISSHVAEPLIPIFFSFFPTEKPSKSFSTINAEIPLRPFERSVIARII